MKKINILFLFLAIFAISCLSSCDDDNELDAFFTTEYQEYEVGEIIYFDNFSRHAESCYWDFDDGYYSDRFNPEHYYTEPGTYTVRLTVENDEESDIFTKVLRIYPQFLDEDMPDDEWYFEEDYK